MALAAEESVSGVTGGNRAGVNQETPPMRIYIIGNDGITLCREPPAAVNEGEIARRLKRGIARRPAQRQTAAGAVERSARVSRSERRSVTATR